MDLVAHASTRIKAPPSRVWDALTNPSTIERYMFGARVTSTWKPGAPIRWSGKWKGEPYEDRGTVLRSEPEKLLTYTHYSPLSGEPDVPESYHTVVIRLAKEEDGTELELTQDHNSSEEAQAHSEKNWIAMLEGMKKAIEG